MKQMTYRRLGTSGLKVSALGLGTMTFGNSEGLFKPIAGLDQAIADEMVKTAFDSGINYFDTADVYSSGQSETILGQALRNCKIGRSQAVIATKFHGPMGEGPNARGASRGHMMDAIHASLERLGIDYIDHYQVHQSDPGTPMEEILRGLDDLISSGLVRYLGVSNWSAWQIAKAAQICDRRGWARIETTQAYYSLLGRDVEDEIVPALLDHGLGLTVWSPLAGGYLSGKVSETGADDSRWNTIKFPPVDLDRGRRLLPLMREIAGRHDATIAQVALAWLLTRPAVTSVIIGAKSLDQLRENIAAASLQLNADELMALDDVTVPDLRYPGWMFAAQRRVQ